MLALGLCSACLVIFCSVSHRLVSQRWSKPPVLPHVAAPASLARAVNRSQSTREIFPLSVIHGGAYTSEELARARRSDPVVAAHYSGFGSHPAFRKAPRDLLLYVSYRRGNQVYWSKTRHKIPQGETVIADGASLARARCGNRLSSIPQLPVAPSKEPAEEVLNTPETPDEPVSYKLTELPGPAGSPFGFVLPAAFDAPIAGSGAAPPAASKPYGTPGIGFPLGLGTAGSGPVLAGSRPAVKTPSKTPQPLPAPGLTSAPGLPIAVGTGPGIGGVGPSSGPGLPVINGFPPSTPGAPLLPPVGVVPEPSTLALASLAFLLASLAGRRFQSRQIRQ